MDKRVLLILIFISFVAIFPLVSSDVISVNSGGNEELVVNSENFVEGFFSCVPQTCTDVGVECGNYVEQCGFTLDCGSCSSGYTCSTGTCVAIPDDGDGGGGGGGGGGGAVTPSAEIEVSPSEFNINMEINTNVKRKIGIKNIGTSTQTVSISQSNLDELIILNEESVTVEVNETEYIDVVFVAPEEPDIYTGNIFVGGHSIPVALNVKTELLLFDSNIVVLNENYQVPQGDDLRTQVTLIPMGADPRLDVTLNYEIRDYKGNVYLTKSETVLVTEQVDFKRNFDTGSLPLGNYVVGLKLVYPNGIAPSSAHFEVTQREPRDIVGMIILWLIVLILLIAILIILVLIRRYLKKRAAQQG